MMNFWRWYRKNDAVLTTIASIAVGLFLIFAIVMFGMTKADPNGNAVLRFMGAQPIFVQTGSMEPYMRTHSIVLVERVDGMEDIAVDDVITYQVYDETGRAINITHRIYNIKEDGSIITKGDNNRVADSYAITIDNVKAKVVWVWNGFADIVNALSTTAGKIMAGVILLIIILIGYALGEGAKYLDEKYGINESAVDSVDDQLEYDFGNYEELGDEIVDNPIEAEKKRQEAREIRQKLRYLDEDKSSWQKIYTYDVDENNLVTVTGIRNGYGSLSELTIPKEIAHKKVVAIGPFAFRGAVASIIHLPDTLERIGRAAFYQCDKLIYVEIPQTVKVIGANAFDGCSALFDIKLPVHLTRIEDRTFNGCVSLNSITINDKVVCIGDSAFLGCDNLQTIYGAKSVAMIKMNAFKTNSPVQTRIITDNQFMKDYNWSLYGREVEIVDSPELLQLIKEDNESLYTEYDAHQEKMKLEHEEQFATKIERKSAAVVAYLNDMKSKISAKTEEKVKQIESDKIAKAQAKQDAKEAKMNIEEAAEVVEDQVVEASDPVVERRDYTQELGLDGTSNLLDSLAVKDENE